MYDDIVWATTILEDDEIGFAARNSFGFFKRTLEGIIGRTLEPTEAQNLYDLAIKELA
jgi:hypothetical protein